MPLEVAMRVRYPAARRESLERLTDRVLAEFDRPQSLVSLLLTNDREMRRLNCRYRGVDSPTNVLSFCLDDEDEEMLLGEVIVSIETAGREAAAAGIPLDERVRELMAHGLLHLLGFDHERTPNDEWETAEARVLPLVRGTVSPGDDPTPGERKGKR